MDSLITGAVGFPISSPALQFSRERLVGLWKGEKATRAAQVHQGPCKWIGIEWMEMK